MPTKIPYKPFYLDTTTGKTIKENVADLLQRAFEYEFGDSKSQQNKKLLSKKHFKYFQDYFSDELDGMIPHVVVVENNYYSPDYIIDYSNFHAHCHRDYGRMCRRLHFFKQNKKIEHLYKDEGFNKYILGRLDDSEENEFSESYMGNIIIKPTPSRNIGKSTLIHYPEMATNGDKRVYWALREYNINLFGKKLSLSSLAFIEQDKSVSVCSTAALYSVFSRIFPESNYSDSHRSPSQITTLAGLTRNQSRIFPSAGLEVEQIQKVISKSNLASDYFVGIRFKTEEKNADLTPEKSANEEIAETPKKYKYDSIPDNSKTVSIPQSYISVFELKKIIFAYSTYKTPIIIITDPRIDTTPGLHAVVAVGYRTSNHLTNTVSNIRDGSDKIGKVFVHDDQYGPFSRLILHPEKIKDEEAKNLTVHSSWDNEIANTSIKSIIVPVNNRITISYQEIYPTLSALNNILYPFVFDANPIGFDLNLWLSNDFKSKIRKEKLDENTRYKILTTNMPKFVWVHRLYEINSDDTKPLLDLVFDATDLKENLHLIGSYLYTKTPQKFNKFYNEVSTKHKVTFLKNTKFTAEEIKKFNEIHGNELANDIFKYIDYLLNNQK